MQVLEQLIRSMETSEIRFFQTYLRSGTSSEERLAERLFHMLRKDEPMAPRDLALALYGEENLNAYHTLRKRLQRKLYLFFQSRNFETDRSPKAEASLVIGAAAQLMRHDRSETAAKLLNKAKNQASKTGEYEGKLELLRFAIKHSDALRLDYVNLLHEWKETHHIVSISQRVDVAYSTLRVKLREVRVTGHLRSLDALVRQELDALGIDLDEDLPAAVVYRMMEIIRMAIIATKEYHQFEPLITQTYRHLMASGRLSEHDIELQVAFSYMVAHTKFRTRKLKEAHTWVERLKLYFTQSKSPEVRMYVPKYYLLKAAALNFDGNNDKAIALLEYALTRPEPVTTDRLNLFLNLTVYYLQTGEFKTAHQTLAKIDLGDRRIEQIMGREWLFKKGLIEMIVLIELDYPELVISRLRTVKNLYRTFLEDPQNEWMSLFISAIQLMLSDPLGQKSERVHQKLDDMVNRWPLNREDLHVLTFRCWLKSRVEKKPYYEVLVAALNQPREELL